jgi:general secretion pathway protein G
MKRELPPPAAFTLLEIMLVVAIIMLLLGSAIYYMKGQYNVAKIVRAESDIRSISAAVQSYETLSGYPLTTEQGLNALVTRPTSPPSPRRWEQSMEQIILDPWGQHYIYECPGKHNPRGFDLSSAGPDRIPVTDDDVVNWVTNQQ